MLCTYSILEDYRGGITHLKQENWIVIGTWLRWLNFNRNLGNCDLFIGSNAVNVMAFYNFNSSRNYLIWISDDCISRNFITLEIWAKLCWIITCHRRKYVLIVYHKFLIKTLIVIYSFSIDLSFQSKKSIIQIKILFLHKLFVITINYRKAFETYIFR